MKKLLLYILINFLIISKSFANNNILSDYISNGIKYYSKDHSKSLGLNIEIKYPNTWIAKEGLRPHIVQKFSSEKFASCNLLVNQFPISGTYNDWLEFSKNTNSVKELFSNQNFNDLKITPTQYSGVPGNLIEFDQVGFQAGFNIYMNSVAHILYYENKFIQFLCTITGETKENSQENMKIYYPLFRLMGNDIILHNIYK